MTIVVLLAVVIPLIAHEWIASEAKGRIIADANRAPKMDVAIVLGAGVFYDGRPSHMLRARLDKAIELYNDHKVKKLLMSGDNRFLNYNEPKAMINYAVTQGVPREDVVADYAGRRTYDTVYRAKHIFGVKSALIVTQGFHMDRAIFLCNKLGLDAYGVIAAKPKAEKEPEIRELLAAVSALFDVYVWQPKPIMGKPEKVL